MFFLSSITFFQAVSSVSFFLFNVVIFQEKNIVLSFLLSYFIESSLYTYAAIILMQSYFYAFKKIKSEYWENAVYFCVIAPYSCITTYLSFNRRSVTICNFLIQCNVVITNMLRWEKYVRYRHAAGITELKCSF